MAARPLSWTGGEAVEGSPLQRTLSTDTIGLYPVTAQFGMDSETVNILVVRVSAITLDAMGTSAYFATANNAVIRVDPENTTGTTIRARLEPWWSWEDPIPEQLLRWEPNFGGPVNGHPEARNVPIDKPARHQVHCYCGSSSAWVIVWVVDIELSVGSDEIYVNSDDDNENNVDDRTESPVTGENDMTYVHTAVVPDGAPVTISSVITLTPSYGLALWEDPDKAYPSPGVWDHATPGDQWVEGTQVSTVAGDRTITMTCQLNTSGVYWQYNPYNWSQWGSWQPWGDWAWTFTKEVHLTVLPRPGRSEAYLKLYSIANPGNDEQYQLEGEGPFGGTLYPALYVTIGAGERIKQGLTGTIVRIHDDYAGYAEGTTVNSDQTVSLTDADGWQFWNGTAWVQATVAPASTDNKNGTFPLKYRRLLGAWSTIRMPANNEHLATSR